MVNTSVKVSIIIPVYNGKNYMREAIDSALGQTYKNIEVLVVNDGSNDNGETDKIARSYGNKIKYFNKENGGVATALNLGIDKMTGDYFSWLSHDDVYKPEKIEKQIEKLIYLPYDTILYSGYELIDENSRVIQRMDFSKKFPVGKLNVSLFPIFKGLANGCTMLIHREHFKRVGLFDASLPTTQDYKMWFDMFRDANIHYCNDINVQMRQHSMQGSKNEGHIKECNDLWIHMLENVKLTEMCEMEGTPFLFFHKMYEYLGAYDKASDYCQKRAEFEKNKWAKYSKGKIDDNEVLIYTFIRNYENLYQENVDLKDILKKKRSLKEKILSADFNCLKDLFKKNGFWKTFLKIIKYI